MKWFLILLAIGLTSSEKLDRTYLPPHGAQFAGGSPGDILTPLELPNPAKHGVIPIGPTLNGLSQFGPNAQPTQSPITTTTSYAFTQTTSFPQIETTLAPINPITGLPVQNLRQPAYQQHGLNLPEYVQNQGQLTQGYNGNVQPGFTPQSSVSDGQPINIGSPVYSQIGNQPLLQYPSQDIGTPEGNIQIPGSELTSHQQGYDKYSNAQPNGVTSSQYPSQNLITSGTNGRIPDSGLVQNTDVQIIPAQQDSIRLGTSPHPNTPNAQLNGQYNETEFQRPYSAQVPQGTYAGRPINIAEKSQINQGQLIADANISQQSSIPSQNGVGSILGQNIFHPGQDYNSISSSTSAPNLISSIPPYSSVGHIIRNERPQAAADRNAVILNYENVLTPNSYSYNYDTSNGIHVDESGMLGDGTRAQGSYSYIGDDGKVYSIIYTADENGFQPRGDHLPTPPPIPEAIKKVIEQAARDKEAGMVDDGSYDEAKYGYEKYQGPTNRRRLQPHKVNRYDDTEHVDEIIPISGIAGNKYEDDLPQDQLNDNILIEDIKKKSTGKRPLQYSLNKITNEDYNNSKVESENGDILENNYYGTPFTVVNNNQDFNNQKSSGHITHSYSIPVAKDDYKIPQSKLGAKDRNFPRRKPITIERVKSTNTQYPGSRNEDEEDTSIYPDGQNGFESELHSSDIQDISRVMPVDSIRKLNTKQRPKGRRPEISDNKNVRGNQPQSYQFHQEPVNEFVSKEADMPLLISDYDQNHGDQQTPSREIIQRIDENGYHYNSPQKKFSQMQLPTRFIDYKVSSIRKPVHHKPFGNSTTLRPFLTPEVYNQPSGNKYNKPTIRKPFLTSRVTTPKDSSYTDYDDDEDYTTQNIDTEDISSTTRPSTTSRPFQSSTLDPYFTPSDQTTSLTQKETINPDYRVDYPHTEPSVHIQGSTLVPSQNFHPESMAASSTTITPSKRPSTSSDAGRQDSFVPETPDYTYQTIRPVPSYTSMTSVPGYSRNNVRPGYDSHLLPGQRKYTPENYSTATYIPTTAAPGTPGTYPSSTSNNYQTTRPSKPTAGLFANESYPVTTPSYYLTTYQQGLAGNKVSTVTPSAPRKPGTFILSGSRTTLPELSATPDQTGHQHSSTIPDYFTIKPSAPGSRPRFSDSESPGSHSSPSGYEFEPSGPIYSTTISPSTIGTTPGRPYHAYPTTQQRIYPTQSLYNKSPDGFSRQTVSEQLPKYLSPGQRPSQYPGSQHITETDSRPSDGLVIGSKTLPTVDSLRETNAGEQSPNYPGYYYQPKVIGEDFSGPKQPQRFDAQTGYHYK